MLLKIYEININDLKYKEINNYSQKFEYAKIIFNKNNNKKNQKIYF